MSGVSFASERLQTGKHRGLEHRWMPDKHPFDLTDEMFSPAMSDKSTEPTCDASGGTVVVVEQTI